MSSKKRFAWYQPRYGGFTHYFTLFGFHFEVRIVPSEFYSAMRDIYHLIDDGEMLRASKSVEFLRNHYGDDPDLIRAEGLIDYGSLDFNK